MTIMVTSMAEKLEIVRIAMTIAMTITMLMMMVVILTINVS